MLRNINILGMKWTEDESLALALQCRGHKPFRIYPDGEKENTTEWLFRPTRKLEADVKRYREGTLKVCAYPYSVLLSGRRCE
jgi:hypothetical protein